MTTTTITKIQRGVLEAAARRNDYAAWPIREGKLNIGSATRTIKELIRKGLVVEKPAVAKVPVWREDDDGRPLMAVISNDGFIAIGMAPARPSGKKAPVAAYKGSVAAVSQDGPRMPRAGSKLALLIELLGREGGATIAELAEATEWQQHSVRGVLSGMLAKKLGMQIVSKTVEGRDRTYRVKGHSRT